MATNEKPTAWTTERPTEPGNYYMRRKEWVDGDYEVTKIGRNGIVLRYGELVTSHDFDGVEWQHVPEPKR